MTCPDCNERPLKLFNGKLNKRCSFCTTEYYKQLRAIKSNEARQLAIKNKSSERVCNHCGEAFITSTDNQKYCYNPCNPKQVRLEKSNTSWLGEKRVHKPKKICM